MYKTKSKHLNIGYRLCISENILRGGGGSQYGKKERYFLGFFQKKTCYDFSYFKEKS